MKVPTWTAPFVWAVLGVSWIVGMTAIALHGDLRSREEILLRRINTHCNGVHDALVESVRQDGLGQHAVAAQMYLRVERDLSFCAPDVHPSIDHPFDAVAWLSSIPVRDADDDAAVSNAP